MDGLGRHDRPRPYFFTFYIIKILEKEVKPLLSRTSTTKEPVNDSFSRTKAVRPSYKMAHQLIRESNPALVQEKPPEFYQKRSMASKFT